MFTPVFRPGTKRQAPLAEKILRNSGFLPNRRWQIGHVHDSKFNPARRLYTFFFRINVGALTRCDFTGFIVIYYIHNMHIAYFTRIFYLYHSSNRKQIIRTIPRNEHTHRTIARINRFLKIYRRVMTLKGVKSASCFVPLALSVNVNGI